MVDPKEPDGGDLNHGLTAAGVCQIIGAAGIVLMQILSMVIGYMRETNAKVERDAVAAKVEEFATKQTEAVAEVKTAIDTKAAEHDDKLNVMLRKVDEVKTKVME